MDDARMQLTAAGPEGVLFEVGSSTAQAVGRLAGAPRLRRPERMQMVMRTIHLDGLLEQEHQARVVWAYAQEADLTPLYEQMRALEGRPGRDRIDPRVLLALWLYATLRGVGSARELARLCEDHVAYQWICGGVSVNYHTVADFRSDHGPLLEKLLVDAVGSLMHEGLVTLEAVAQDGMRVRASAGASSFRREPTPAQCLTQAQAQVEALAQEAARNPGAGRERQQAARRRAAEDRLRRVRHALAQLPDVQARKKADAQEQARVSTTDPDARVMKMADGGYRPAHNVPLATDVASQIITAVEVVNIGSDFEQLAPMVRQHEEHYEQAPAKMLVDGGFAKHQQIEEVSQAPRQTVVYAPVPKSRSAHIDEHLPKAGDSPIIKEWRARMAGEDAKQIYKQRASTAECVNAIARNRGLNQFPVRGLAKVHVIALWFALAHNIIRAAALRARHAHASP